MYTLSRGVLISIEGIDGSGKSTLAHNLYDALGKVLAPVFLTKEPGGTDLGKLIRPILQKKEVKLCNKAEYLLFAADRAQHFDEFIIPRLKKNSLIISDRMADSSLVYQGYARGLDLNVIKTINSWAMCGIKPNLTIYVRLSPDESLIRLKKRNIELTSFEGEKTFTQKVAAGFEELFNSRNNVILLEGTQAEEVLTTAAVKAVITWLQEHQILL